jgi:nicotinate phosphoribosyltransferase
VFVADKDDIKKGRLTDVYFTRTLQVLKSRGIDKWVRAEFMVKTLPGDMSWAIFAGLSELSELVSGLSVKMRAMREGTVIRPYQPVLEIEGMYTDFAVFETSMLGFMCQASGIATKAARCKKAADGRPVISFGARRIHPAIAPMVERNAFIGGCDGVSVPYTAEMLGEEPSGTMPHSLILLLGDTVEAAQAFDEVIDRKVNRIVLVDTFNDEKVEAIKVAEALRDRLYGIRLDTPQSRRGDFARILEEIRWELALRGLGHVKLYVSGGVDETQMTQLNQYVDGYGVGTAISNARVLDFAMDIVEIEGKPIAKRGKMSGAKRVLRCTWCCRDRIVPFEHPLADRCECGGMFEEVLVPWYDNHSFLFGDDSPQAIRQYVLQQLPHFGFEP